VNWRLLEDEAVGPARGLAVDDALTRLARGDKSPALRLYTYSSCALIGRFQHIADEINLDYCGRQNIPVNRRPTGGGAIIMGPDQLGIALVIPSEHPLATGSVQQVMCRCAQGVVDGLANLGIHSELFGKNDLLVAERKIAGLGLYRAKSGGVLFHASVLLDLDIQYMLKVLRTALYRSSGTDLSKISERICTVRIQAGKDTQMSDLKNAVQAGYQKQFGIEFESAVLDDREQMVCEQIEAQQYSTEKWIFDSHSEVRDYVGDSELRTAGGTLEVRAIVAGKTIKSIYFGGDFIASDNAVLDLEESLRWHIRDSQRVQKTVFDSVERNAESWHRISALDLTVAVNAALERCLPAAPQTESGACFAREVAGA